MMPDTISVKTKEVCPRCGGEWEALCNVEVGADKPKDGWTADAGIICPQCEKRLANQTDKGLQ